jgi:uncharacterized lipoprotein YmbA
VTSAPITGFDPAALMKQWMAAWKLAPDHLDQPILPWTWAVTVNNNNSGSPATEAEIVGRYSYGRQLGRISEALACLLEERGDEPPDGRVREFLEMVRGIEEVKKQGAVDRAEQLRRDLVAVRDADPARYAHLLRDLGLREAP